jgi:anti-sigma factor (TIGR02949 family)
MRCEAMRGLVSAYLDGELVGEDLVAFEAHLAACAECRRLVEEERAVVAAVRSSLPLYAAPESLRERVEGLLEGQRRGGRRAWVALLAGGALLAAVLGLIGWGRRERPGGRPASEFADLAADTHLRCARGQLPLEVATDQPELLSRWFSGRVPFHLALPDYPVGPGEQKFYHLEGGRLVSFKKDYAAYVAYRMDEQPVSLLVTSAEATQPSGGDTVTSGALTFHLESVAGLQVITWSDNGLTYALASDVTVSGARSCLVCHGSPEGRRRLPAFPGKPRT